MKPDPCLHEPFTMGYEVWVPGDERDRVGLVEPCFMNTLEQDRFGMSMVKDMARCLSIQFFGTN